MDAIVAVFLADPFKVLLGSGGVVGLIVVIVKAWRSRASPRVRLLGHTYDPKGGREIPTEVRVEIENVGREPTSLQPKVSMTCRYPGRRSMQATFQVTDGDRSLQPVSPRNFVLHGTPSAGFLFSHFRVYTFQFTRGGSVKLRVLNASGKTAGPLKFWFLKWLFVLTGALPHVEG
ncbi:hypothetical protein H8N03_25855 [Ramlibacter sp. USB13]|uniref:Uncharacterized protein n=1 Tax=Ramlibacter cellulosilyticus TaxID=2764187 RepID=A0A923MX92_9BURK|nr:hypothetical protein [Ramlibacter cellulosilyticus]MBC5786389.1 hypothetical protein [Ramlibacter cellulosilyticus]